MPALWLLQRLKFTLCLTLACVTQRSYAQRSPEANGPQEQQPASTEKALEHRLQLGWSAPAHCPSEQTFIAQVRARTPTVEFGASGAEGRVRVLIEPEGTRGRIEIIGPEGEALERSVQSADCVELVDVLGFVLAVSLDPSLLTTEPAVAAPQQPPVIAPAPAQAPKPVVLKPRQKPATATRQRQKNMTAPPPARSTLWAVSGAVGAQNAFDGKLAPALELGVAAWLPGTLEAKSFRGLAAGALWAPQFTLRGAWTRSVITSGSVSGDFNRLSARLEPCPITVGLAARWFLLPCAELQAGALFTDTEGLVPSQSRAPAWLSAGGRIKSSLRWSRLWLDLGLGLELNFTRYAFRFRDSPDGPQTLLARVPQWTGSLSLEFALPVGRADW